MDGLECTLYMVDIDVIRLAEAIDMQEVNLWNIVTDLETINTAIKAGVEKHEKAMEQIMQRMDTTLEYIGVIARGFAFLNEKIEKLAANRYSP